MSTVISEIPPASIGRHPLYPWPLWTDGRVHVLARGTDFQLPAVSMRSTIYGYATRHGLRVLVRQRGDQLTIQFSARDEAGKP